MNSEQFRTAEPLLDAISEEVDKLLDGADAETLRKLLGKLASGFDDKLGVSLRVELDVADWEREKVLTLLQTGISVGDNSTYRTYGDSTLHRYLVGGEIVVVPSDSCPKCWSDWGFKFKNTSCPSCLLTLGEEVLLLLDSDICPFCEEGKVSSNAPTCDSCGFEVDQKMVNWG